MVMRKLGFLALIGSTVFALSGAVEAKSQRHHSNHEATQSHSGMASMYGTKGDGYSGGRTASGERVHSGALTAAHKTLPFGTMVRVTNRRNNKSVVVRINDRGPFVRGRVIDLTPAAARAIGIGGLGQVTLAIAGRG